MEIVIDDKGLYYNIFYCERWYNIKKSDILFSERIDIEDITEENIIDYIEKYY